MPTARSTAQQGKRRSDTKQAELIKLPQRKRGASVDEAAKALSWQPIRFEVRLPVRLRSALD
jgi:hypothetical protein